jgi:hypothetical protein
MLARLPGHEPLLWQLAMSPDLRLSIAEVARLPAPLLWEAEAVAVICAEQRAAAEWERTLQAAAKRAHEATLRGRYRERGGG